MITNRINPLSNAILPSRNNLSRYLKKKNSILTITGNN